MLDLTSLLAIAQAAGAAILDIYQQDFAVSAKADQSPLTAADLAAHRLIQHELTAQDPETPLLSEESASIPFAERQRWSRYWLVDPLDGTKEFIKRNGEFTVNIALIENHRPVLGIVHVPVSGVTYYGGLEMGAYRRDADGATVAIRVRETLADPVRVVGSRSHAGPHLEAFLQALGVHELVSMGSSLKLCLVAEGAADLYPRFGPTSEWDTAAAHAVVLAAGGQVTDLQFNPLQYNTKDTLLNPHFLVFGRQDHAWQSCLPKACESSP